MSSLSSGDKESFIKVKLLKEKIKRQLLLNYYLTRDVNILIMLKRL